MGGTVEKSAGQAFKERPPDKENASPRHPESEQPSVSANPPNLGLTQEQLETFKTEQRRRYCSWWKKHDRVLPVWARLLTLDQLAEISNLETIVRELFDDREPTKKDFLKYYRKVKSCKSPDDEVLTRPPLHRLRINGEWRLFFVDDVRTMKKEYEKGNVEAYFFRPVEDEEQEAPDPEIAAPLPAESIVEPEIQAAAEEAEEEEVWQPPVEEVDLERFRRDSNIVELLQNLGKEGPRLEKAILQSFNCWKEGGKTATLQQLRWIRVEQPEKQIEEQQEVAELSSESQESLLEELQCNDPISCLPSPPKPAPPPVVSLTPIRHSKMPPRTSPKRLTTSPKPLLTPPTKRRIEERSPLQATREEMLSPPKQSSKRLPAWMSQKSPRKTAAERTQAVIVAATAGPNTTVRQESQPAALSLTFDLFTRHTIVLRRLEEELKRLERPHDQEKLLGEARKIYKKKVCGNLTTETPADQEKKKSPPKKKVKTQRALLNRFIKQTPRPKPRRENDEDSEAKAKETRPMSSKGPNLVEEWLEKSQNADPANYGSPPLFDDFVQPEEPTKMEENQQTEKRPDTTPASLLLAMLESAAEPEVASPPSQQQPMETDEVEARVEAALAELHSSHDQSAIADPPNTHDSSESGTGSHVTVIETPPSVEETPVQVKVEPDQHHSPYNDSVEVVEVPAPVPITILDETTPDSQQLFANMGTAQPQNNALAKADQRFLHQSVEKSPEDRDASQTLQQSPAEASSRFVETHVEDAEASSKAAGELLVSAGDTSTELHPPVDPLRAANGNCSNSVQDFNTLKINVRNGVTRLGGKPTRLIVQIDDVSDLDSIVLKLPLSQILAEIPIVREPLPTQINSALLVNPLATPAANENSN